MSNDKTYYPHAKLRQGGAERRWFKSALCFLVVAILAVFGGLSANGASAAPPAQTAAGVAGTAKANASSPYPWHTKIVSTTFWVGEIYDADLEDGSQVCSTYDGLWAAHWSGVSKNKVPSSAEGCAGSPTGGCDGIAKFSGKTIVSCETSKRLKANNYFATGLAPKENPFYLDLPYDDLNDETGFDQRCAVIPWANAAGFKGHCDDEEFSYMKNRWVRIVGPNGQTCYGQVEDAGPSHDDLYHDKKYVFGKTDARPTQKQFNNAGMDVSPALNSCLGFKELDGQSDKVSWQFVDNAQVPAGPWTKVVTKSGVTF
ncbi:MAG: hypothetical protein JWQ43_3248 [Glaciihabitans sp.]|nr:hypothetical protein [Glaciihabitans sp.]